MPYVENAELLAGDSPALELLKKDIEEALREAFPTGRFYMLLMNSAPGPVPWVLYDVADSRRNSYKQWQMRHIVRQVFTETTAVHPYTTVSFMDDSHLHEGED
jgi:hypothetical protein